METSAFLSLTDYVEKLAENFGTYKRAFPHSFSCAEQLDELFWELYTSQVVPDKEIIWQPVAHSMLFGCITSWCHAFATCASGLDEHALTSTRRSIEFACYIAKICNSEERAGLWITRRDDEASRKRFTLEFGIPQAYFSAKYTHLKRLLVIHDHASEFATHANLAMLAQKFKESGSTMVPLVFDDPRDIPLNAGSILQLGSLLIQATVADLAALMQDRDKFLIRFSAFQTALSHAKTEILAHEQRAGIEPEIVKAINAIPTLIDDKFEQMKKDSERRGRPQ